MPTTVRDWMSSPVIVVDPDSSVSYALTLMRRRNIHSLVVYLDDRRQSIGIITSTDIRDKIMAAERDPAQTQVREIMTAPVYTANPDWTLQECSRQMQSYRVHHMPVMGEHGEVVGLISATDLFRAAEEIGWGKK